MAQNSLIDDFNIGDGMDDASGLSGDDFNLHNAFGNDNFLGKGGSQRGGMNQSKFNHGTGFDALPMDDFDQFPNYFQSQNNKFNLSNESLGDIFGTSQEPPPNRFGGNAPQSNKKQNFGIKNGFDAIPMGDSGFGDMNKGSLLGGDFGNKSSKTDNLSVNPRERSQMRNSVSLGFNQPKSNFDSIPIDNNSRLSLNTDTRSNNGSKRLLSGNILNLKNSHDGNLSQSIDTIPEEIDPFPPINISQVNDPQGFINDLGDDSPFNQDIPQSDDLKHQVSFQNSDIINSPADDIPPRKIVKNFLQDKSQSKISQETPQRVSSINQLNSISEKPVISIADQTPKPTQIQSQQIRQNSPQIKSSPPQPMPQPVVSQPPVQNIQQNFQPVTNTQMQYQYQSPPMQQQPQTMPPRDQFPIETSVRSSFDRTISSFRMYFINDFKNMCKSTMSKEPALPDIDNFTDELNTEISSLINVPVPPLDINSQSISRQIASSIDEHTKPVTSSLADIDARNSLSGERHVSELRQLQDDLETLRSVFKSQSDSVLQELEKERRYSAQRRDAVLTKRRNIEHRLRTLSLKQTELETRSRAQESEKDSIERGLKSFEHQKKEWEENVLPKIFDDKSVILRAIFDEFKSLKADLVENPSEDFEQTLDECVKIIRSEEDILRTDIYDIQLATRWIEEKKREPIQKRSNISKIKRSTILDETQAKLSRIKRLRDDTMN